MLTLSTLHNFESLVIDFDQAYTQAPINSDIYINPPSGFHTNEDLVLKLKRTFMVFNKEVLTSR